MGSPAQNKAERYRLARFLSPALLGEGMVETTGAGFLFAQQELLQLQFDLSTGDGT